MPTHTHTIQRFILRTAHLPILIVPHEDVVVDCEPSPADLWEHSHHAVALHI